MIGGIQELRLRPLMRGTIHTAAFASVQADQMT
jgi:hypothetical protein